MRGVFGEWAASADRHLPVYSVVAHAILVKLEGGACPQSSVGDPTAWASTVHTGGPHLAQISVHAVGAPGSGDDDLLGLSADAGLRSSSSPSTLSGVVAHGRVAGQNSSLRFWDPCGKCTLSALADGQYSPPVVFYFTGHGERTGEIHFALQEGATGEPVWAKVTAITIVFGPNSQIPSLVLCIGVNHTDCVAAKDNNNSAWNESFVPPTITGAPHEGDVVIDPPASFFARQVVKDRTLRFEFASPREIEDFHLRLHQQPNATGDATPWGAVREDNLLFGAVPRSAWMQTLATTHYYYYYYYKRFVVHPCCSVCLVSGICFTLLRQSIASYTSLITAHHLSSRSARSYVLTRHSSRIRARCIIMLHVLLCSSVVRPLKSSLQYFSLPALHCISCAKNNRRLPCCFRHTSSPPHVLFSTLAITSAMQSHVMLLQPQLQHENFINHHFTFPTSTLLLFRNHSHMPTYQSAHMSMLSL